MNAQEDPKRMSKQEWIKKWLRRPYDYPSDEQEMSEMFDEAFAAGSQHILKILEQDDHKRSLPRGRGR